MVSGRCCISLKTKSWREDSYCVKEKNTKEATTIYWSYSLRMDILADPPTEAVVLAPLT